jgi:hypothetical protein
MALAQSWSALTHDSGGLGYHFRAALRQHTLWLPFRKRVAHWVQSWATDKSVPLLLVGPSAGHTLPTEYLKTFSKIRAIEPDPLARLILRSRIPHVEFLNADILSHNGETLEEFVKLHLTSKHKILFCNVLGQRHLIDAENHSEPLFTNRLFQCLGPHSFASYHDRLSIDCHWSRLRPGAVRNNEGRATPEELAKLFFTDAHKLAFDLHESIDLQCESAQIRTAPILDYSPWVLGPRAIHIVEWVAYS